MSEKRNKLDRRMTRDEYVDHIDGENKKVDDNLIQKQIEKENVKRDKVLSKKKDKKILAIVGTAGSRHLAPYDNSNCEIWGVGHCLLLADIPRMDKVFEIHLPYVYEQEKSPYTHNDPDKRLPLVYHANKEHALSNYIPCKRIKEDVSVIVSQENPKLNKQEIFPREKLKEKYGWIFPPSDAFYCTNSIAWMLCYAIDMDRFDEIHLYGIHLETDSEWQYERPCNELWLGFFMGKMHERGIKTPVVYLPEMSDVLRAYHEYGFAEIEVNRKKYQERASFFDRQIADLKGQRGKLADERKRLIQELQIPFEEKKKYLSNQIEIFSKELEAMNKTNKEEYTERVNTKINERLKLINGEVYKLDCKTSAVNGAYEQTRYTLKQFNA